MSLSWRGEDRPNSLPPALEGAVSELQALLEPTPAQLAASYQRVRETLAGLPPAPAAHRRSDTSSAADSAPQQNPGPERWRRIAADCRRAAWVISGGAALALIAGFALGRLSSGAAVREDSPPTVASADPASAAAVPAPVARLPNAAPAVLEQAAPEAAQPAQEPVTPVLAAREPPPKRTPRADRSQSLTLTCERREPVQRAECWLRREQPRRALQALCGSNPGQEREREQIAMLKLVAECKLGRDVRGQAQRFFAEWPDSPLALRIRNECPRATSNFTSLGTKSAQIP